MRNVRSMFIFVSAIFLLWPFGAFAAKFKLDEGHSNVGFKIQHLVISKVTGRFNKFEGTFDHDEKKGTLENINVKIMANSIDTNEADRDKHLKAADFFDVEKYPTIEFVGTKVNYKNKKPTSVEGNLTMRGVTKPVTLKYESKGSVTDPWGNNRIAFEASTKISRKDFGLNWNKTLDKGGVVVGEDVNVIIEGEGIQEQEKSAEKVEEKK